jgi:hypothetical protein
MWLRLVHNPLKFASFANFLVGLVVVMYPLIVNTNSPTLSTEFYVLPDIEFGCRTGPSLCSESLTEASKTLGFNSLLREADAVSLLEMKR